jgi:hypothetical protein
LDENRKKEDNFFEIYAKQNGAGSVASRIDEGTTPKQASIGPTSLFTGGKKLNTM